MGAYNDRAILLWSLSGAGLGGTISAAGNSGGWGDTPPASFPSSAISLDPVTDIQLMVWLTGKSGTPVLTVQLGYYDSQGHLFAPSSLLIPNTTFSSLTLPGGATLNAGSRAGAAGTYVNFSQWANIAWTCSGGSYTGAEIELWGR